MKKRGNIYQPGQFRAARVAILLSIVIILILTVVSYIRIQRIVEGNLEVRRIEQLQAELQRFYGILRHTEGALNYYLLTGDTVYYREFEDRDQYIAPVLNSLVEQFASLHAETNMGQIDSLCQLRERYLQRTLTTQKEEYDDVYALRKENNDALAHIVNQTTTTLDRLIEEAENRSNLTAYMTPVILLAIKLLTLIILFFAYQFIMREYREKQFLLQKLDIRNSQLSENLNEITRQKEFMEAIQNGSFNLIAVYDMDGRFISMNRKCEEVFGVKSKDAAGKTFLEVFPGRSEAFAYRDLQRALLGETVVRDNFEAVGPERYFQSCTMPVRENDGNLGGVVAIAHEITHIVRVANELTKANEALTLQKEFAENLLHTSIDAICVFDTSLRFVDFNKTAAQIFGMTAAMKGEKITDLYPKFNGSKTHRALLDAVQGRSTVGLRHRSVIVEKTFESFVIPLKNQSGVYAIMLIHHDISDFVTVTEQLTRKNRELERSNAELEQFAFAASHDLQEPLRKIQTFASMVDADESPARVKPLMEKIRYSASRMSDLIRNVLDFSKVRLTEPVYEEVDLNKVVEAICDEIENRQENDRSVSITVDPLPQVTGSAIQLGQLFRNLLENAIKFSERVPQIHISSSTTWKGDTPYHRINIKDNGIGFDPKYVDQIFQVFKRLHGSHKYNGTGIGLAICKRIVTNHRGFIAATTEPGKGSTFSIFLPVAAVEVSEPELPPGLSDLETTNIEAH